MVTRNLEVGLTVNQRLADRYIRHVIAFERLKNGQVREIIGRLNVGTFPDLLGLLSSSIERLGRTPNVFRTKGYQRLLQRAKEIINEGFRSARIEYARELYRIAQTESQFTLSVLGKEIPFDFRAKLPTFDKFRDLVYRQPIDGMPLRQRFDSLAANTFGQVRQQVNRGIAAGETTERIVQRVRGTTGARFTDGALGKVRRWTEAEVRTAATHAGNGGRSLVHKENPEVVRFEKWIAVLDDKTCPACAGLDSQVFKTTEGPQPPIHHQCRCIRSPVLKSAKELGVRARDLDPIKRRSLSGDLEIERTFPSWLRSQDIDTQNKVLGVTRARLWRGGKIHIDKFVNNKFEVLNLEQLAKQEGFDLPAALKKTRSGAVKKAAATRGNK